MAVRQRFKAAFVAISLVGLAACGSEPVDPAMFDAEVQTLANDGDLYGEMFVVLKDRRPELYSKFRKVALHHYGKGRTAKQGAYLAGLHLREEFLSEILDLSRVASDEHVKEMIGVMRATYEHLNTESAADCLRLIDGDPLETVTEFPSELRKRETQLIVDLLNSPQTVANRRAASQKEVTNWMMNVATLEPSVEQMIMLMAKEEREKKDAAPICEGMITLYKRLSYKKSETRGTLFRGMALMALQQQQIQRNAIEEDEQA